MKKSNAYINIFSISLFYKIFVLVVCCISLMYHISPSNLGDTFRMLGYFTVLSNFFCFAMLTISIVKMSKNQLIHTKYEAIKEYGKVFTFFKGMCLMSIILTFCIFHFMVANYKYPLMYNQVLHLPNKDLFAHYLVPLFYTVDWLLFQPKGIHDIRSPFFWTIYPFIYMIITLLRLYAIYTPSILHLSKCPYFFLDVNKLGIERVAIFSIIILFAIIGIGYSVIGIETLLCHICKKWCHRA